MKAYVDDPTPAWEEPNCVRVPTVGELARRAIQRLNNSPDPVVDVPVSRSPLAVPLRLVPLLAFLVGLILEFFEAETLSMVVVLSGLFLMTLGFVPSLAPRNTNEKLILIAGASACTIQIIRLL